MQPCGARTCGSRERCDTTTTPPMCVCREAYTGEDCAACASGYRPTAGGEGCEPVPIDCDADPLICGAHGACVVMLSSDRTRKIHSCDCEEGWGGHVCQRCADNYQDNDGDGVCAPGCTLAMLTCAAPLVCSDAEGVARCACPPGYAGDDCTQCARGFHDPLGTGTCTATCAAVGLECGERQMCSDAMGDPVCVCIEGYAGEGCTACAEGYGDTVRPGDCRPTCAVADLDCGDHGACVDRGGIAQCGCSPGWAGAACDTCARGHRGDDCELCESGWYRRGDDACVAGCSSGYVSCASGQRCWDGPTGPECLCDIGYAGPDCTACATGFVASGARCIPMPTAAHVLVASGTWRDQSAIVAIDPASGTMFPLRSMSVSGLAWDPMARLLFTATTTGIAPIDLASGTTGTPIVVPSYEAFTFDTMRRQLLLTGSGGTYRVTPATGARTTVSATGPMWIRDAAYDAATDRMLVVFQSGAAIGRYDATSGTHLGTVSPSYPIESSYGVGIAVTPAGETWVIGRRRDDGDSVAADGCRRAARGLAGLDYATAPATVVMPPMPGGTVAMASARASGPEVIVLRSYGDRSATTATVRITSTNPDAFVCIGTYEGVYRIQIASTARFAGVAAESYEDTLSAMVESGFATPPRPTVHVMVRNPGTADPSLSASPGVIRVYSPEEWYDRRVSIYSGSTTSAGMLVRVDPATGMVIRSIELPELVPTGSLSPFAP